MVKKNPAPRVVEKNPKSGKKESQSGKKESAPHFLHVVGSWWKVAFLILFEAKAGSGKSHYELGGGFLS